MLAAPWGLLAAAATAAAALQPTPMKLNKRLCYSLITLLCSDSLLSACANGTASGVDENQATSLLKYLSHPSCSSADLKVRGLHDVEPLLLLLPLPPLLPLHGRCAA